MVARELNAPPGRPDGKVAGVVLVVGALGSLAAILHHPTVSRHGGDVARQIVALAATDRIVHGALIAICTGFLFALAIFSLRRGLADQRVVAALIAYSIATAGIIAAGSIDGFLLPDLGERAIASGPTSPALLDVLAACSMIIQIATKLAMVATGVAIVLWSWVLVGEHGWIRATGIVGIVAASTSVAVSFSSGALNPHNLFIIVLLQNVWYASIGALMVKERL